MSLKEKVYTVGCFDQFHYGHIKLLDSMKCFGKYVIVCIHDDDSLQKLKNLEPNQHKNINDRIADIQPYCDEIHVVNSIDPTETLRQIVHKNDNFDNAVFIRGDDNKNFPGKSFIESRISIQYHPYTQSISSTMIRKQFRNRKI
jgi:cytidyltransferase-like protein